MATTKNKPLPNKKNILITSALPYVNNVPHLGNIIGCVLSADVYARFCRGRGYNPLFICGTDEYGTATEAKALEEKLSPKEICDKYFEIHKRVYDWFQIDFDYFGRTSTDQQTIITHQIFDKLMTNGYIKEDSVEQLFCRTCQKFLADRFVIGTCPKCSFTDARGDQCDNCGQLLDPDQLKEPRCKLDGTTPVKASSKHLFLDLPKLKPQLEEWLSRIDERKWTPNALAFTKSWLRDGLQPRCITRDLKWGTPVPLPGYEDKVFYVWFDACLGYLSITANYTPDWEQWWKNPDQVELVQFMGKDNVPFHTIVFPSTLLGTHEKYTLLNSISTTEYLNFEDGKFSKSRGIGVFGDDLPAIGLSSDVWRFYLLRNRPESFDSIFSWNDFAAKNNSELLANLGNFVNRTLSFCVNNFNGLVPKFTETDKDRAWINTVDKEVTMYIQHMETIALRQGLSCVMNICHMANHYFTETAPWVLLKEDIERCRSLIALFCNVIYLLIPLIFPFMPTVAISITSQLQCTSSQIGPFSIHLHDGHKLGVVQPLFKKIEDQTIEELRSRFNRSGKQPTTAVECPRQFNKTSEMTWPSVIIFFQGLQIQKKQSKNLSIWMKSILKGVDASTVKQLSHVIAYQAAREKLDIADNSTSNSVVNLINIVTSRGSLPSINSLVDVYNAMSYKHGIVMGAYDVTRISGNLTYTSATGKEKFTPINKPEPEVIYAGEWILRDDSDEVVTKLTTKQSAKSVVTISTTQAIMCIQGNNQTSLEFLSAIAKETAEKVVQFCGGSFQIVFEG